MLSSVSAFAPATSAFQEGQRIFQLQVSRDPKKRDRLQQIQATSLEDLVDIVRVAQKHYESTRGDSKIWRGIKGFSEKLCYYGNIFDVLVQQHPEYVALAWGTMKLLFGAIVEHEKIGTVIIDALEDITNALPRVELAATLYPTTLIKQAVAVLYARIIRFLLRALEWYEEGRVKRALHSITKPAALRYNDIIQDIHQAAESIAAFAVTSSQVEQRDMHGEVVTIRKTLETSQLKIENQVMDLHQKVQLMADLMSSNYTLHLDGQSKIYQSLSAIQSTQAIQIIHSQCVIDHQSGLQASRALRGRRRLSSQVKGLPFWQSPRLQQWNKSTSSCLFLVKSALSERRLVQDFCTNAIEQLISSGTAVFWILKHEGKTYSIVDTIKSLIQQAVNFHGTAQDHSALSFQLNRFIHAQLEEHYLDIFTDLLQNLKLVYIAVQAQAIPSSDVKDFQSILYQLIGRLSKQGNKVVVRILVLDWEPGSRIHAESDHSQLKISKVPRRKGKKLPNRPLNNLKGCVRV
ncbi:hypothetical protein FQN49_001123 [Arthroderma sp. PD_2]|nr:hypothetical protein FQN49_001123 [Arthroderma sp. PD_2]